MFKNIGKKIKIMAYIFFAVFAIADIVLGIVAVDELRSSEEIYGYLLIFFGPVIALVSSFLIYGFGELIENSGKILNTENHIYSMVKSIKNTCFDTLPQPSTSTDQTSSSVSSTPPPVKKHIPPAAKKPATPLKTNTPLKLKIMLEQGVISQAEYDDLISSKK